MDTEQQGQEGIESQPATATVPEPEPAEEQAQEPAQTQEPRLPRKDRQRLRVDVEAANRERDEMRRQLETERQERQRMDRELAEMRGRFSAQQEQQADPLVSQIDKLRDKAEAHLQAASSTQDQATAKRELRAYHETLEEIGELKAERKAHEIAARAIQQVPNAEAAGMKVSLGAEFPWLSSNQSARDTADGYIAILMAKGRPNNLATYREACAMAARDFNLGGNAPKNGHSRAFDGIPGGDGAGGGGDESRTIPYGADEEAMAMARYPELTPEQAKAKWLKNIGPKVLANRKSSNGR